MRERIKKEKKKLSYLWLRSVTEKSDGTLTVLFGLYAGIQEVQQDFPLGNSLLFDRGRANVAKFWKKQVWQCIYINKYPLGN